MPDALLLSAIYGTLKVLLHKKQTETKCLLLRFSMAMELIFYMVHAATTTFLTVS